MNLSPRFISKEQTQLIGFSFFGDPFRLSPGWTEENEIGLLWQRFMRYLEQYGAHLAPAIKNSGTFYEVHIYNEETQEKGTFEVFVGAELADVRQTPLEMLIKVLPATTYAIFTIQGEAIVGDWPRHIYGEWLPHSDYEIAHQYHVQYYTDQFKGMDRLAESSLDIYVPVQAK
jgi:predicted transcriptional regulator YdeE